MKKLALVLIFNFSALAGVYAQSTDVVQKQAIKKLDWLLGKWTGEVVTNMGSQKSTVKMRETIKSMQGGKTRYKAFLNEKGQCIETGEFSKDGTTWYPFSGLWAQMFVQTGKLTVAVTNLRSNDGVVLASLYKSADGFPTEPKKSIKQTFAKISGGKCTLVFEDVPAGTYAVSVMHDENNDRKMQTNWMGIPKEGTAASNGAKGKFGPPKFEDAKFKTNGSDSNIDIKMWYF